MNEWTADIDRRIWKAISTGMDRGLIKEEDPVVILTGWKPGSGATNTMRIIAAHDMSDKELLPPIVGMSSVPSFSRMKDTLPEDFSSISVASSDDGDVKFF